MPPKNVILDIISHLDIGETRFIRQNLRGKKLRLFNELVSKKKFDQEDLAKEFRVMEPQAYAVLRSKLAATLATLIGEYKQRDTSLELVRTLNQQADAYLAKGKSAKAVEIYEKAVEMADKAEQYTIASELVANILLILDEDSPESPKWMIAQERYVERGQEAMQMTRLQLQAQTIKSLRGIEKLERAKSLLVILESFSTPVSIKGYIYWLRAKIVCLVILRNPNDYFPLLELAHATIDRHPEFLRDPVFRQAAIGVHLGYASFLGMNGKSNQACKVLSHFMEVLSLQRLETPVSIETGLARFQIEQAWENQEWEKYGELAKEMFSRIKGGQIKNPNRRVRLSFYLAKGYLEANLPKKGLECIERVFMERRMPIFPEYLIVSAIIELICVCLVKDWERLSASIRNAEYLFRSKRHLNAFTTAVLEAFRKIDNDQSQIDQALRLLATNLQPLSINQEFHLYLELFDLEKWIRDHLEDMP